MSSEWENGFDTAHKMAIALAEKENAKLRGLLEEWLSWSGTPFYDNDAARVRMLELKRRTREALEK